MLAIWSLVPLPFLNPAWTSENSYSIKADWNLEPKLHAYYVLFIINWMS